MYIHIVEMCCSNEMIVEASRKLLLILRKTVLVRKNAYVFTLLQFLVTIIFILQIRLIFEPQALRPERTEPLKVAEILSQMPKDVSCRYAPNHRFVSEIMSEAAKLLRINIAPVAENEVHGKNSHVKSLWAIFNISDDQRDKPTVLDYKIRSYDFSSSLSAMWNDEEPSREDPYMVTGFIPLQIAIDISFLNVWEDGQLSYLKNKVRIGRFPYHTLNLLVMPVLLEPSVTVAYYLMIIALLLIPAEVLYKVVHDKYKGFRELMYTMGMSPSTLYAGWMSYMLLIGLPAAITSTIILNPILVNAYPPTVCLFVILYLTMSTCFMFFVGSFFDDSLKACLVGTMLWLVLSYLSAILSQKTENMRYSVQLATLCLPHTGLLYGLSNFAARQDTNIGEADAAYDSNATAVSRPAPIESKAVDSEEAITLVHGQHRLSLTIILASWALHACFWILLTLYFDSLRPGRLGAARSWYYPCEASSSAPEHLQVNSFNGTTKRPTVEKAPTGLAPIITIRQITKTFGSMKNRVVAIDGMNIDFYEGEFHIILGHNGAGKSTLLKMIVGILKPTRGDIYILGRDYNRQKDSSKYLIGYCPQDNILVNDLTAIQHVYLFGMLKGMPYKDAFDKAEMMLTQLGLGSNRNDKVQHFSLGMKRRVCLSMALIGNSKILVLDEPGYGVDPQNRRRVWDTLLAFREQRTIIMTTNSMEAADVLPDRIAIIANGKVECYGTKMYLNRRFGVAYLLSIVVEEDCDLNHLTAAIQNFSSDQIKLRSRLGSVMKYDLPRRTMFTRLLKHLEHNVHSLRIKSLGLSVASIEEQFRRIGFASHIKTRHGINGFYDSNEFEIMIRRRRYELLTTAKAWKRMEGWRLFMQQIGIMFYKKYLHVFTSWNLYGYSLLFSLITSIVCMEMAGSANLHVLTTRVNQVNISKYTAAGLGILLHRSDESSTALLGDLIDTSRLYDSTGQGNYYYVSNDSVVDLIAKPTWNSIEIRERYFLGIDVSEKDGIDLLYSVTASHSGPISVNFLLNALLRHNGCKECLINTQTEPILDRAHWQSRIINSRGIRNWQNFAVIASLFLLLPSITLATTEFRSSSKQLQLNTIGMSVIKYWAPIYITDIMIYLLCLLLIAFLVPFFYNIIPDVAGIEYVRMLVIFLLYGIAALPMGYIIHFFVRRVEIMFMLVVMLNVTILTFINGNLTHPILTRIVSKTGRELSDILLHIFPQYTLACAVGNFLSIQIYNFQCRQLDSCSSPFWAEDPCCDVCGDKGCFRPLSTMWTERILHTIHHSIMLDITILSLETFMLISIVMFIESSYKAKIQKWFAGWCYPAAIHETVTEPHVICEKERADEFMRDYTSDETDVSSGVTLSVQSLSKKFGGKAVVRGISFNVYKHDCLGLLGMTGAGKSTIFKMLSGEILPTSGKAVIQKYDLAKDKHSFASMIGYCPQIGGLNKFMTARQNLRLHATLRGVPLDRVRDEVDKWLDVFDLLDYENIKLMHCPWGIRKKISILQSLIGDLPVVLLDEPTSGLDAIARQVVCDSLHFIREMGRSLLVSTQSMEEAETLCFRIGILVNGQFVVFGSSEQLKHQHGDYFTLNIAIPGTANQKTIQDIKSFTEIMFTGFDFKSFHAGILKYEVNASAEKYSVIFERIEKLKARYPEISDSSVSQTTLEHVFLSLCEKYQDERITEEKSICGQRCTSKLHTRNLVLRTNLS